MSDSRRPGRSWTAQVERIGWLVSGPLALVVLALCLADFDDAYAARDNRGLPGTFVTVREDCGGRGGCTAYGDFTSDNSTLRLEDVFIDYGGGDIGESTRAQYVETEHGKVYELDSREWLWLWFLTLAAGAWACGWVWVYLVRPVRARRSS